jgi:hypothetical protein
MKLQSVLVASALSVAVSSVAVAGDLSRGFLIEQGNVAKQGTASVDLGVNGGYFSGAARLGLGKAEVVLGEEKSDSANKSEVLVKLGMPAFQGLSEMKHGWAIYGGLSAASFDSGAAKDARHLNLIAGVAFTGQIDALEFTAAPELVINTYANESEVYVNLGLGGYFNLGKTQYGSFKPGAEVLVTTQDGADSLFGAGVRWEFNDRVTIDALPVVIGGSDELALPGQLRLNAKF